MWFKVLKSPFVNMHYKYIYVYVYGVRFFYTLKSTAYAWVYMFEIEGWILLYKQKNQTMLFFKPFPTTSTCYIKQLRRYHCVTVYRLCMMFAIRGFLPLLGSATQASSRWITTGSRLAQKMVSKVFLKYSPFPLLCLPP